MATKTRYLTVKGEEAVRATLGVLAARAPVAAGRALTIEANAIMRKSKRLVPVDMGALRASGRVLPPVTSPHTVFVTMRYGDASAPYALYVHEGIGPAVGKPPFMPPVENIKPWARRVLGDESAAFPVARAIGRRGVKGKKFLETPLREAQAGMGARLAARIKADIAATARGTGGSGRLAKQATKGRIRRRFYY